MHEIEFEQPVGVEAACSSPSGADGTSFSSSDGLDGVGSHCSF